jgi:toxin ParE1/3/4
MAPRIIRSKSADRDLTGIWNYVAREASPSIADFVIARLFEAMHRAAENPLMYPQSDFRGRPRRVNVFEYAIFYEPLQNQESIRIRRIIHGRRELDRLLRRTKG